MVEMVAHGIFGEARGLGARQPVLGLALNLRITDEDRQHHLAAVEYILGGDMRRLFLPDQFAERPQPLCLCGAQPRFVRAARVPRDGVAIPAIVAIRTTISEDTRVGTERCDT